jgi:hypothetical protein
MKRSRAARCVRGHNGVQAVMALAAHKPFGENLPVRLNEIEHEARAM